jgi:hypothetical protein
MNKPELANALSIILDLDKGNKELSKLSVKTLEQIYAGINKNFEYLKTLETEVSNLRYEKGLHAND